MGYYQMSQHIVDNHHPICYICKRPIEVGDAYYITNDGDSHWACELDKEEES